jgi:hypothetical protein
LRQRYPPHDDVLILVLNEELAGGGAAGQFHQGEQLRQVIHGPRLPAHPGLKPFGFEGRV